MIHWPRLFATGTLILIGFIAGCTHQPLQPVQSWPEHKAEATALTHWQLSGKLAVRLPDDSSSARLGWRQSGDAFRIDLSGPFGQGRVIIDTTDTGVRLRQGGEPPLKAATASELVWRATGWQLPVESLLFWIRGIPAPDSGTARPTLTYTPEGLLETLSQNGWNLSYSDYHADTLPPLPGRIIAQHGEMQLMLIIHRWQLPEALPPTSGVPGS